MLNFVGILAGLLIVIAMGLIFFLGYTTLERNRCYNFTILHGYEDALYDIFDGCFVKEDGKWVHHRQ